MERLANRTGLETKGTAAAAGAAGAEGAGGESKDDANDSGLSTGPGDGLALLRTMTVAPNGTQAEAKTSLSSSSSSSSSPSSSSVDPVERRAFELMRTAGQKARVTFPMVTTAVLSTRHTEDLQVRLVNRSYFTRVTYIQCTKSH